MKNRFFIYAFLLVLTATAVYFTACTKQEDDPDDNDQTGSPVIITGSLDASAAAVTGVLAIGSDYSYKQAAVSGNNFSLKLDNGQPWGLVFLDASNQPLGLLSLGNGIEALPLHLLDNTIDSLDLKTISRDSDIFTPAANPIGGTIPLSPEQMALLGAMDDYLASVLKNPDVNGNGTIDLLEGRSFRLSVIYFIKPGNFHVPELSPSFDNTTLIEGYRLFLTVEDNSYPETVYFSGPGGSPLSNTPSESYLAFDNDSRVYATQYLYDLLGSGSYIPVAGVYTVKYGNETLTFNLPDQSYVNSNIVFPYPTVTLTSEGMLSKVDWVYRSPAGVVNFDVQALVDNIMVQLEGTGPRCEAIPNQNGTYGSGRLPAATTSHTLACQDIRWGNTEPVPGSEYIIRLMMTYEDHFGASYVVMYEKEY